MTKRLILTLCALSLTACHTTPSPQDTTPDLAERCKALRMQMDHPAIDNANSSTAVDTANSFDYASAYKAECV
jgi:hypothetical protein